MRDASIVNRRLTAANAVALCCAIGGATYGIAELSPSPLADLILQGAPLVSVILWLERDTRRTQVGAVYDLGLLAGYFALPFIPWYGWKTRGWWFALLTLLLINASSIGQLVATVLVKAF